MRSQLGVILLICLPLFYLSCATSDKESFNHEVVQDTTEFEEVVKIVEMEQPPEDEAEKEVTTPSPKKETPGPAKTVPQKTTKKTEKKSKAPKAQSAVEKEPPASQEAKKVEAPVKKKTRQPPLEDDEGFDGRRPVVQPYKVGEEIVLGISYFGVEAGKFTMQVKPMVQVNGKKSYHFRYLIKTSPLFNMIYSVDDVAETFVDYNSLLPHSYEIHVNESKQVRETRTYFDHQKKIATMWDSKQKKNQKVEKKKIQWDIIPYSQNVFSAAYYLRNFTLKVGKELKVRVGHEGKNIEMTAKVIRRELIYTTAGKFDTFVVQPQFDIDGKFKPTGENYLWLTADDKKFIVRLESKIKIGTIVGEVQKIKK